MTRKSFSTEFGKQGLLQWGFSVTYDSDRNSPKKYEALLHNLTNDVPRDIAISAQKTIQKWLAPGGTYKIGWTGKAARSLQVGRGSVEGANSYYLYEGGDYGLTAIRTGTRSAAYSKKVAPSENFGHDYVTKRPPVGEISAWVKARRLKPQKVSSKNKWYVDKETGRRKLKKTATAAYLRKRIPYAVAGAIANQGTSVSYKQRFGKHYFDYIKKYVDERNYRVVRAKLLKEEAKIFELSVSGVTQFLNTAMEKRGAYGSSGEMSERYVRTYT